jgi:hypothetical protein
MMPRSALTVFWVWEDVDREDRPIGNAYETDGQTPPDGVRRLGVMTRKQAVVEAELRLADFVEVEKILFGGNG